MLDLTRLQPRDASASALADALSRTEVAARGVSAEIGRLKAERDTLLVVGTNNALAEADAALKQAVAAGETVMALHAELKRRLDATTATLPAIAEEATRLHAVRAAAEFGQWWATNGASMHRGLQLLAQTSEAVARWHGALQAVAPQQPAAAQPSNVVPLQPSPGAA